MHNVTWAQPAPQSWYKLKGTDFSPLGKALGVYTVWHDGNPGKYVRLGQGVLAARLAVHQTEPAVLKYEAIGVLRVTWAIVPTASDRDRIERYLAETLKPLVGDRFPDVVPLAVNLPGAR
jgi:hypothetical protein